MIQPSTTHTRYRRVDLTKDSRLSGVSRIDQIYELDLTLVDEAEWLLKAVDEVLVPEKDPPAAIAEFLKCVEDLHRQFDRRSELLQGLGPSK